MNTNARLVIGFSLATWGQIVMTAAAILSLDAVHLAFPLTLLGCGALFAYCGVQVMRGAE